MERMANLPELRMGYRWLQLLVRAENFIIVTCTLNYFPKLNMTYLSSNAIHTVHTWLSWTKVVWVNINSKSVEIVKLPLTIII